MSRATLLRSIGRPLGIVLASLVCVGAIAALATGRGSGTHPQRPAPQDRYLGGVPPRARVSFALTLRVRTAALERYAAQESAGSAAPLSATQIGDRFGLSNRMLTQVRRVLRAHDIAVDVAFRQRTQLLVSGPASQVQRLLGTSLGQFSDPHGGLYHRPLTQPTVPPALRAAVVAATGLDDKRIPLTGDIPSSGLAGSDLASLYDLSGLTGQGLDGSGQTVAVFSMDTFQDSDIAAFDQEHNIVGAPPIQRVEVDPKNPVSFYPGPNGSAAGEVDLDTEVIQEIAPKAQILNYEVCCSIDNFAAGINRIVSDGRAKLVNFSYGLCELLFPSGYLPQTDQTSFAAAQASGVTVFASSGDQGAYSCQRYKLADHRLAVEWPSSSPHVVGVGGTYVDVRQDGTRLDELGWEDILSNAGGGGGVSAVFPRPSWQTGVTGVNNQYTTSPPRRQVPDVAADAAPGSGYTIYSQGQNSIEGGTSAAAPFWTGSFVLIDELAQRQTGHLLPFIAPLLYKAAARDASAFDDVTLGGNRYYRAGPGWDYSTGLGTPDMSRLASDVIAIARGR